MTRKSSEHLCTIFGTSSPVCHAQVFAGFSGHGDSICNIIPLLKKRKCT